MICPIIRFHLVVTMFAGFIILQSGLKAGEINAIVTQVAESGNVTNRFSWHVEDKAYQGQADTNGLACKVSFGGFPVSPARQPPVCLVYVTNKTTNTFRSYWRPLPEHFLKVELLDSLGKPVKKTTEGQKYEASISKDELEKIYHSKRNWRSANIRILPTDTHLSSFGLPDLFEPKVAGEYTLKVQMRLIQAWPEFKTVWLPEVVVKIQVQSSDGLPVNLSPLTKTNSPSK